MSEEAIIRHCSPTLADMKTGSMFSGTFSSREELNGNIRAWNRILHKKGLRVIPLKYSGKRALIYVYRPIRLKEDFQGGKCKDLLQKNGYPCQNCSLCIARLMKKLRTQSDFPHEIGLFLGYPPEDVKGFMEHKAEGCKCVGYWKVYTNVEKAEQTFEKYRNCTDCYMKNWYDGISMEQLAVSS
ncbi:MAG: DUF3793 family protein [Oscillospiraceae bacterium]